MLNDQAQNKERDSVRSLFLYSAVTCIESVRSIVPAVYIALPTRFIILRAFIFFEFFANPKIPSTAAVTAPEIKSNFLSIKISSPA